METNLGSFSAIGKTEDTNAEAFQIVKLSPFEKDEGEKMLLSVETNIQKMVKSIAKRDMAKLQEIGLDISEEEIGNLPTSITGIMVHYLLEGLEKDCKIKFDKKPKSIKTIVRGTSNIKSRKRFITREQKNTLLERTRMSFYDKKLSLGILSMPEVLQEIQKAYEEKKHYESIGLILSDNKTEYPKYQGVDYTIPDKDKTEEHRAKEEHIISRINEKIVELASAGLIAIPKQERKRNEV
jgi:hypothetical protein